MSLKYKTVFGGLIWIASFTWIAILLNSSFSKSSVAERLKDYFGQSRTAIELHSTDYQMLGIGDPIFVVNADGDATRVGNVSFIDFGVGYEKYKLGDTKIAVANLYGNAPKFVEGDYLRVHEIDQSIDWIIRTMFPPTMRKKIVDLISEAWQVNQEELVSLFRPLIEESFVEAGEIIQQDLKETLENHREEIDAIAQRFQDELLEQKILPLVRDEIWPIVQDEVQPLTESIGREIWSEVSVLRFGWRYLYDRSPLPEKKLTEKEFNRFVDNKAMPIIEGHLEDFIDVQKRLLSRISENEKVKQTVSESVREVASDAEFQQLVTTIIREVLVENPRLRNALRDKWQSPEAKRAMLRANRRLDPTVIEIGATLFGSTKTAITPEFARVLRNKVLHKDARWLTLHTKADGNRDVNLAKQIIESKLNQKNEDGLARLPMFVAFDNDDYPIPAAPPIESKDRALRKSATKKDDK